MDTFITVFNENIKKYGAKTAIIDRNGARRTTYKQLDTYSSKVASAITRKGLKKGSIIPVKVSRSMEFVAAEIGILKAGCIFAPLAMDYPKERVDYILKDCGAEFYIDDNFMNEAFQQEEENIYADINQNDGAFVVYTSGSTGKPKGIIHEHKSLYSSLKRHRNITEFTEQDVYLSSAPFYFVAMVFDIYMSLFCGGTLHILPEEDRKDIKKIENYLADKQITVTCITPQLLKLYQNKSKSLRVVITGSERVSNVCGDGFKIINTYGSSETTPAVTYYSVDQKYDNTPIGKAAGGFNIYLLDEYGKQVTKGEEGEICVSGVIARGYLNLPEQTKKAFTKNPFDNDENSVLFHTNDIGKELPDGNILYVNRKDWMVKINGQRVETGEIEAIMNNMPQIHTAVVKGFENKYTQTYLCAFYKVNLPVSPDYIKEELLKRVPEYMVPMFMIELENLPINQNGKLDRKALMPPDISEYKKEYIPWQNETQRLLCEAFENILQCKGVGIDDDFFALGGDSIMVVMLQKACESLTLTSKNIFMGRTPRRIAELCKDKKEDCYHNCNIKKDVYRLTDSQMGVFLECLKNTYGTMYNIPVNYAIPKEVIDINRLKNAVHKVVNAHPAFNIHIEYAEGMPVMVPNTSVDFNIPIEMIDENEIEEKKKSFVKPFDLQESPLFRFAIYETQEKYYFLADFHHIIFDGTSLTIFGRDLEKAYQGEEIQAESISLFEISTYEEGIENSDAYKEAQAYFERTLAGCEVDSNPIFDYKENKQEDKPCQRVILSLQEEFVTSRLMHFAKSNGITENTIFLGAFSYVLSKYSGQEESLLCTVNNGRHDPRLENTVGMLVRTLPIYTHFDEAKKIGEYLQKIQSDFFETICHDCYHFQELANLYGINSNIMYVYQAETLNGFTLNGVNIAMEPIETSAISNIALMVFKKDGGYELSFEYRSDLYKEATIKALGQMMLRVLNGFLNCQCLKDISLISDEQAKQIDEFNQTQFDYDESKTIVDMFREQVKKTPDNIAVVYENTQITYRQLDEITDRVAIYIHNMGLGAEDVVSILVSRSEYMPITALGTMKAGTAYQPLDSTYPPERLAFMMQDAEAKILIADEDLQHLIPEYNGEVLLTKDIAALPSASKSIEFGPAPEDLMILLYTSGSTGKPKGCMLVQKNLVSYLSWYNEYFNLTEESRVISYASFGFDVNMMDMYSAFTVGAQLHIIPEELRLNLPAINEYFKTNKITHACITTQIGRAFALSTDADTLQYLMLGGEKLVPFEPLNNCKIYNIYGPTECTISTSYFLMDKLYENVPIGKPFGNTKLYVTDKYNRLLPVGIPGELCIAGHLVSRGYLKRPDLTAEKFIDTPFTNETGYEKMYRTGDIVRYLADGNIEFIGRCDGLVKIRGFRIELTEVEGVIRQYKDIKDATVVAKDAPTGGKCLVAYVVSDKKIDIESLKKFILNQKPPYMVPTAIMQIDKIPLNPNCKVDKRKLPEITFSNTDSESSSRPLTYMEKGLAEIISGIVGSGDLSITANLMHAGLNSLSAIKLASELNKTYGFSLDVKELMKGCSILSIENEIQKYLLEKGNRKEEHHKDKGQRAYYPLSQSQLGVYYDCMKRPMDIIYNVPILYGLSADVDVQKLADSAKKVVIAHPYIMTHITMQDDEVVQIPNTHDIEIPVLTMTENELNDYKKEFVKPFNLFKGTLYRISVVKTEKGVYLLADFHHIIFDGGSLDIFLNDLKKAYEGQELICEGYSCFDYVEEEIRNRNSESYQKAKNYFDIQLRDFESASKITPDINGKEENGELAESLYPMNNNSIEEFCRGNGITPAYLFLAGTFYTISRYTNSKDVYISTISNGRTNLKIQNSVGMYVKTLALAANIGEESVLEFVENAKKSLLDTISFEAYPFTQISAQYGFTPEIMYACQLGILNNLEIGGNTVSQEGLELKIPKFKTSVHIEERDNKICVCIQYNDALYSKHLMDGLAQSIGSCVEHMMKNPNQKLKNISLLNPSELNKIKGFRESGSYELEEKLLHKVFQKQSHKVSTRKALIANDGEFTYEQLNILTNRLANGLISFGVRPGERIAILLNRTSRLIISMFGIMKAGCAYIPCDPEYPVERINNILEDSNAIYIITTSDRLNDFPAGKAIDAEKLLLCEKTDEPSVKVLPTDLAYLIYTSGSTGKPKGVMLEHQGICNYVYNHRNNIHVHTIAQEASCMLSVTTISFDMSLKEIGVALCNGLTLALADEEEANNPILLAKLFEKTNADVFNATPSRMLQYLELPALCNALAKCKVIMSGGEKYSEVLLHKLKEITRARIFNTYGPTEITVSSNAKELTNENNITIGRPLLNYKEFIVDSEENELPVGVVGELYIGGIGVARGYNNLEALTSKQFITYQGIRVYKSGDYAKWAESGDVVILGRADSQVKLRGLRIELGEIESCITKQKGIKNAVVLIRKINETEHICAYFSAEYKVEIDSLKDKLKKTLTSYMVPSAYLQLENIPLTPNGKIDIKSLPEPELAGSNEYIAPRNKAEEDFCQIFSKTLGIERIGIFDNFFECGGTSLLVTKVTIEAINCGYSTISYGDVFAAPTPKLLAEKVSGEKTFEETAKLHAFDYSKINKVLTENNLDRITNGEYKEIGNILLTGATGFLGIHILKEYLDNYSGKVYCLLRKSRRNSLEGRVKSMLVYYFEKDFEELFGKRIFLIEGDVTCQEAFVRAKNYDIDTVINCAANVKHFAKDGEIEKVNIGGVKNAVDFAIEKKARLIQISTASIAGYSVDENPPIGTTVNEQQLYVGQKTDNKYVDSKFIAERIVLEAIAENKLDGKIMRVGNLMARNCDGEFQANCASNSFVNRLRAYYKIGCINYSSMNTRIEFAPIDSTAKSILLLASTPKECCVFHAYNNHEIYIGDVIHAMNQRGMSVKSVEDDQFKDKFSKALEDKNNVQALSGLVAYLNMGKGKPVVMIPTTCNYTIEVLYRLGFKWPLTTDRYLDNFIFMLDGLGFFDRK